MKQLVVVLLLVMFSITSFGQFILWEKQYSFLNKYSAIESFDNYNGKYVLSLSKNTDANFHGVLAVINETGDTLWTKTFAQYAYSNYRNTIKIINGNIYYMPSYLTNPKVFDTTIAVLLKVGFDRNYEKLGEYQINGLDSFFPRDAVVINDTLFYMGVGTNPSIPFNKGGGYKNTLLKLDLDGNEHYQNYYPQSDTSTVSTAVASMIKGKDGLFVMYAQGSPPGKTHPYIIQLDAKYDTIKTKLLFSYKSLTYYDAQRGQMIYGTDGNYYICGAYKYQNADSVFASGRGKPFIAKLDTNFNILWVKYTSGTYGFASRIHELPSGDILFVSPEGRTKTFINIYKVGKDGTFLDSTQANTKLGTKITDIRHMMYFEQDSSVVYAGVLDQYGYLAKISLKKLIVTGTKAEENQQHNLSLLPNPTNGLLEINSLQLGNLEIYDVQGHIIRKLKVDSSNQQINVQDLNSGTYLYRFSTERGVRYGKFIRQ